MIDKYKKEQCNGCKMCKDLCPQEAISYYIDHEGFWYPKVNYNLCNYCELCIKLCPQINGFESKKNKPEVFAAWSNDKDIRLKSTSGGIFYELAKNIINSGGYVVGARYTQNYMAAEHIIVNSLHELEKIIGSKYLQSDTENIYKKTKNLLDEGKKVLFCGTPCHNGALTNFLHKEYSNLIQCDFICRGISSPKAQQKYIEMLEELYGAKVTFYRSKDKREGWNNFGSSAKFENDEEYFAKKDKDARVAAYHKGNLIMRLSCHDCKFRKISRVSDITLGDFWGIEKSEKNPNLELGTSVVLLNSQKGKELFESIIKDKQITRYEKTLNDVLKGNPALLINPIIGINRNKFFKYIDKVRFDKLVNKYQERTSFYGIILKKYKSIIKKILYSFK